RLLKLSSSSNPSPSSSLFRFFLSLKEKKDRFDFFSFGELSNPSSGSVLPSPGLRGPGSLCTELGSSRWMVAARFSSFFSFSFSLSADFCLNKPFSVPVLFMVLSGSESTEMKTREALCIIKRPVGLTHWDNLQSGLARAPGPAHTAGGARQQVKKRSEENLKDATPFLALTQTLLDLIYPDIGL
ncbi:hypothetical protein GOODEAATRI_028151, partial [Goodea atripinnis]